MRLFIATFVISFGVLASAGQACAQRDLFVPAGTLLQCTMDEPNFSSATASVGDPVLCHLRTQQEFGRPLFPRGSMLGGHLEAEKDPGHFVGKGYLQISFDRVILPYGDLPVPAKVIQARGFKVDKQGDIDGKGHAKRDAVEWAIPVLWPWKIVSLPKRGPRPTLKGEEPLELRLMDDISIPALLAYGSGKSDRPPYATQPSSFISRSGNFVEQASEKRIDARVNSAVATNVNQHSRRTILVLKSDETLTLAKYRRDGNVLTFEAPDGTKGAVDVDLIDWLRTTQRNRAISAD